MRTIGKLLFIGVPAVLALLAYVQGTTRYDQVIAGWALAGTLMCLVCACYRYVLFCRFVRGFYEIERRHGLRR